MSDVQPLAPYIKLEDGLEEMKGHKTSKSYITALMNIYVRDTPFQQLQIVDLHQKVQSLVPGEITYSSNTISRQLRRFRKEDLVVIFDDHEDDLPQERLFVWAQAVPDFAKEVQEKENEQEAIDNEELDRLLEQAEQQTKKLVLSDDDSSESKKYSARKRNPATPFFKALFRKLLGTP